MPLPWIRRIRQAKELTVFNKGGAWGASVTTAVATFNGLGFGVTLVAAAEEKAANIVAKLSDGNEVYPYYGQNVKANFDANLTHGQAAPLADKNKRDPDSAAEIYFAVVFLPAKIKNLTAKQKELIVVHEFIHACGMTSPQFANSASENHDTVGIMAAQMKKDGDGFIEYLTPKGATAMPPIRVGGHTMCVMRKLWAGEECRR